MITDHLEEIVQQALTALSIKVSRVHLEHPADLSHGDFSTNVALVAAKKVGENPKTLAEKIAAKINGGHPMSPILRAEVAGPGFINFYLSREFFTRNVRDIVAAPHEFGANATLSGKKVILDYTDPNPFKEIHIGHLMSNAIGESLSRIFEFSGAEVKRANYQGDVGLHVAKAVWGLVRSENKNITPESLGAAYALGARMYEEEERAKEEIILLNKKIYEQSDGDVMELYEAGRTVSLDHFEKIYSRLGTKFDFYFFESGVGHIGKRIVEENLNQDDSIFEISDGAVIFPGEKYGLHTRVFINSAGLPTYEAKELGLAKLKFEEYPHDLSFAVTGSEITEYFKVIQKALSFLFPDMAARTKHIPHGMLRLPGGKMSSRTGDVIAAERLLNEAKRLVLDKMKDTDIADKDDIADMVGIGAVKYSILRNAPGRDIIFDFDTSLSLEGDSGPYLQYTYARARSVLGAAKEKGLEMSTENAPAKTITLERLLYRFPEAVLRAGNDFEPHHIAIYLTELAGEFNSFYAHTRIAAPEDHAAPYHTALTSAVADTLKNGLHLLGISAPERM